MKITLTASTKQIIDGINSFNPQYHDAYFTVINFSFDYLRNHRQSLENLSRELIRVLTSWGAGKRGAPSVAKLDDVVTFLTDPAIVTKLSYLAEVMPSMQDGKRHLDQRKGHLVTSFDKVIVDLLNEISMNVLVGNTNVTYPMKAVLLLTGLMPAFDSQVKSGLSRGGVKGVNATQFLLPPDAKCVEGAKITRLPFYLGDLWEREQDRLNKAIKASNYPQLVHHRGRVFDVLFFMQARTESPIYIKADYETDKSARDWYQLE